MKEKGNSWWGKLLIGFIILIGIVFIGKKNFFAPQSINTAVDLTQDKGAIGNDPDISQAESTMSITSGPTNTPKILSATPTEKSEVIPTAQYPKPFSTIPPTQYPQLTDISFDRQILFLQEGNIWHFDGLVSSLSQLDLDLGGTLEAIYSDISGELIILQVDQGSLSVFFQLDIVLNIIDLIYSTNQKVIGAFLSPNGQFMILHLGDDTEESIRLLNISEGTVLEIAPCDNGEYKSFQCKRVTWTPDSSRFYWIDKEGMWEGYPSGERNLFMLPSAACSYCEDGLQNFEILSFTPDGKYAALFIQGWEGSYRGMLEMETKSFVELDHTYEFTYGIGQWLPANVYVFINEFDNKLFVWRGLGESPDQVFDIQGTNDVPALNPFSNIYVGQNYAYVTTSIFDYDSLSFSYNIFSINLETLLPELVIKISDHPVMGDIILSTDESSMLLFGENVYILDLDTQAILLIKEYPRATDYVVLP